jgi:homocysteine S-methyltransferase
MDGMPSTLAQQLARRDRPPVILDGGLATELERRGQDVSGALWSARVLREAPDVIWATHAAYFAAGAQVATTASYQATYGGFGAIGVSEEETTELLRRSVRLADEARTAAQDDDRAAGRPVRPRWVAASVGPYGAMLADGSEYRGDYGLTVGQLRTFHRPRLEVLAQACLDLAEGGGSGAEHAVLACETIPSLAEVEALAAELAGLGVPAWVSVTPAGDRLRSGEPLVEAFRAAAEVPEVVAVGVNCCEPSDVDLALAIAAEARLGVPVIAYPNTGEGWDAAARAWTGRPTLDASRARAWRDDGARALGGCCRVGPALLSRIAEAVS